MRIVMDTDAVVAAMRSPSGASAALLLMARTDRIVLTATVPLCVEYEAVCNRPEHLLGAGLDRAGVAVFLAALVSLVEPAMVWFLWRPQLRDPGDELVLGAAVAGRAGCIATFNRRDFRGPADRFGVEVLLPAEVLRRLT
jgi:predicted nucleic acid-binding protein